MRMEPIEEFPPDICARCGQLCDASGLCRWCSRPAAVGGIHVKVADPNGPTVEVFITTDVIRALAVPLLRAVVERCE